MVTPPSPIPTRVIAAAVASLKPYVLKLHFTEKYVSVQVIHTPTGEIASSASSVEKVLRPIIGSTGDVVAAAKIGKLLGERLLLRRIGAVSFSLRKEQKYKGRVKALVDAVTDTGVEVTPVYDEKCKPFPEIAIFPLNT